MLTDKPISMSRESKPGKNPKNGARAFICFREFLWAVACRMAASSSPVMRDDTPAFLLLRWAGLRVSDAVQLRWKHVHFGRGARSRY